MRILLATDAWLPQVNGVVRTLQRVRQECEAQGHVIEVVSPDQFRSVPCPTYPEIRLALRPGRGLAGASQRSGRTASTSRPKAPSASRLGGSACAAD
jgi:hypothetical protein